MEWMVCEVCGVWWIWHAMCGVCSEYGVCCDWGMCDVCCVMRDEVRCV